MMTWENRWHPLLERWVTITSHRGGRPWSGGRVAEGRDRTAVRSNLLFVSRR